MGSRRGFWAAGVLAVVYAAVGWARHRNHWSGGFDLGVFDHAIWRVSQGEGVYSSLLDRSILGDHLSPVLLLFVPLYALAPSAGWLFAAQGAALGATVLPVRAMARELGSSPGLGTAAVVLSAPLLAASVFDVHPAVFAVPLVAGALVGALRDDARLTVLCAVGILLCRVDLVLLVVGVAVVRWNRATRLALWVVPVGAALTLSVPSLVGGLDFWSIHFPAFGTGPLDALLHPTRIPSALTEANLLDKALIWLLPVGFLTLLRPRWVLALAVGMLPALLSQWPGNALPWYHHAALAVPFVIGGALEQLEVYPERRPLMLAVAGMGAVVSLAALSPLSSRAPDDLALATVLRDDRSPHLDRLLDQLDPDDAVSATNTVVPHLDHRLDAWVWPAPFRDSIPPELGVVADASKATAIDAVIVPSSDRAYVEEFGFEVVDEQDGLVLGKRPTTDDEVSP